MASQEFINKIKKLGVRRLAECLTELTEASPGTYMGRCPNPDHEDAKASFMVKENEDGMESWCCFGCHTGEKGGENFGSDNIAFVQWIYYHKFRQVLSFPQAVQKVAKFYGVPMENSRFTMVYRKNREVMEHCEQQITPFVKLYLTERGLDETDIQKWHLGFDGNRITFPIFNSTNEVIGFSNRAFSAEAMKKQKYWNTPEKIGGKETGFHKRACFYGIQFVNPADRRLFIFEGQMDAIIASKYGIPNAVAIMTCHMTDEQAQYIAGHKFIPIVCFDPDDAGKKGAMQTMEKLQKHGVKESRVLFLPDSRDMADLGRDLKEKLYSVVMPRVMPFYQYILKEVADEMDATILEKQEELMPKVKQAIANVADEDERELAKSFIERRIFKTWAA